MQASCDQGARLNLKLIGICRFQTSHCMRGNITPRSGRNSTWWRCQCSLLKLESSQEWLNHLLSEWQELLHSLHRLCLGCIRDWSIEVQEGTGSASNFCQGSILRDFGLAVFRFGY